MIDAGEFSPTSTGIRLLPMTNIDPTWPRRFSSFYDLWEWD
jgi:hypothetical protein